MSALPSLRMNRRWVAYAVIVTPFILSFFMRFAPGTFSGQAASDLHLSSSALGLATSAYFYVYTAMQLPAGFILDRLGIRRSVGAGTLLAAAGLAVYAGAGTLAVAVTGSVLIGAGSSVSFLGVLRAVGVLFSATQFAAMTGVTLFLGNIGSVASGAPLSLLLDVTGWRTILLLTALLAALSGVTVAVMYRTRSHAPATQVADVALRTLLRDRFLWLIGAAALGTNATYYAVSGLWGTPALTSLGLSRTESATVISASLIVYGIAAIVIGRLTRGSSATRRVHLATIISAVSVLGWCGYLSIGIATTWIVVAGLLLAALAAGAVVVGFSLVAERYSSGGSATALALVNGVVFLGVAVLQQVMGVVADASPDHPATPSHYTSGAWLLTITAGLCALAWVGVIRHREPDRLWSLGDSNS